MFVLEVLNLTNRIDNKLSNKKNRTTFELRENQKEIGETYAIIDRNPSRIQRKPKMHGRWGLRLRLKREAKRWRQSARAAPTEIILCN